MMSFLKVFTQTEIIKFKIVSFTFREMVGACCDFICSLDDFTVDNTHIYKTSQAGTTDTATFI